MDRRRKQQAVISIALLAFAISACRSDGVTTQAPRTPAPTASSPEVSQDALILDQYRALMAVLPAASRASSTAKARYTLRPFAGEPALGSILRAFAAQRDAHQVVYGVDQPHPRVQSLDLARGVAVLRDCSDSSGTGLEDARTGRHLTKGPSRNPAFITLHRIADNWLVVFIQRPGGEC